MEAQEASFVRALSEESERLEARLGHKGSAGFLDGWAECPEETHLLKANSQRPAQTRRSKLRATVILPTIREPRLRPAKPVDRVPLQAVSPSVPSSQENLPRYLAELIHTGPRIGLPSRSRPRVMLGHTRVNRKDLASWVPPAVSTHMMNT